MTRITSAAAILIAILLGAACGGSDATPAASTERTPAGGAARSGGVSQAPATAVAADQPGASKLDPCALLPKAAAEAAAGEPLKDGEARDAGNPLGQRFCAYSAVSDRSARLVQLSLVTDAGMAKELRDRKYTARQLFTDSRGQASAVPGVGEDAYVQPITGLHVLQRDVYFAVSVTGGTIGQSDKPLTTESLVQLGRSVLERLPR